MNKGALKYFRVHYSYPGGKARTVTQAKSSSDARRTFQRENPHVTVIRIEGDGT